VLREPRNPEDGITIYYEGYGSFGTELQVGCDPRAEETGYFSLKYNVQYTSGITGANYSFQANSAVVCPMSFLPSQIPSSSPSPRPPEQPNKEAFWTTFENNFSLDLERFNEAVGPAIIGADGLYEKVNIKVSPAQRSGCIPGFACPYEDANIWKCWNTSERVCVPIGDFRYGLAVASDPSTGVRLRYAGGLGGYETELILTCDSDLAEGSLTLGAVGRQILPSTVITLYARTSQVCPGHILIWRDNPTGGAIFLVFIYAATSLYLFVAVVAGVCREGQVRPPNRVFWRRLRNNVIYALFVCIRRHPPSHEPSDSCEGLTEAGAG
jgi:hypothetical protein